jgi:hypothetical protein
MGAQVSGDIEIYLIVTRGDGGRLACLTYQIPVRVDAEGGPPRDDVARW